MRNNLLLAILTLTSLVLSAQEVDTVRLSEILTKPDWLSPFESFYLRGPFQSSQRGSYKWSVSKFDTGTYEYTQSCDFILEYLSMTPCQQDSVRAYYRRIVEPIPDKKTKR